MQKTQQQKMTSAETTEKKKCYEERKISDIYIYVCKQTQTQTQTQNCNCYEIRSFRARITSRFFLIQVYIREKKKRTIPP